MRMESPLNQRLRRSPPDVVYTPIDVTSIQHGKLTGEGNKDKIDSMCRSIKTLRRPDGLATEEQVREAALQFVRKVSGYRAPSRVNKDAFDAAVDEITAASGRLLGRLSGSSRPTSP